MTGIKSAWPAIPKEIMDAVSAPNFSQQGMPDVIEPCPRCRSRDIKWGRNPADGIRAECMPCRRRGGMKGPPASDMIKGMTWQETMWARRDEAYRLWNEMATLYRFLKPQ